MSWEPPALTSLTPSLSSAFSSSEVNITIVLTPILSAIAFWWLYSGGTQSLFKRLVYAVVCATILVLNPRRLLNTAVQFANETSIRDLRLHVLLMTHFKMVLTIGAVLWLLHRSWQTLWKPVPDLIGILGVDVPESPDVSLAGIRSDAATLSWTRPSHNRPVQKFSIQVNGVHVGDSPGNEIAITVTGLKPNHFYNIRVVAVGTNNFRAGSQVIRLRTFGKDGKPQLGNSRLPTNFAEHDSHADSDDSDAPRHALPSVEAAPVLDGSSVAIREVSNMASGPRRNTINRRHSPSVASADQPHAKTILDGPELSLDELNRRFESIRAEIEETQALYAKEEAEFRQQEEELKKEKDRKRQALKEREEQTAQLKALVRTSMEQMRVAEKERAKREQQLKDKESKKSKVRDNITRMEKEVDRMKRERKSFDAQKSDLKAKRDQKAQKLDDENEELADKCAELEAELKDKGKQLQDLKEAREQLAGADDDQSKEEDVRMRREWEVRRGRLHAQLVAETKKGYQLEQHIRILGEQLSIQSQSGLGFYNHPEPTNTEFEPQTTSTAEKRLSHNSNSLNLSPPNQFAMAESGFSPNPVFSQPGFFDPVGMADFRPEPSGELTEAEADLKASAGPMSPSMAGLLPSFLLHNNDVPEAKLKEPEDEQDPGFADDFAQSPASSKMSFPAVASPYASSQNLAFPQYGERSDSASGDPNHSPQAPLASGHRLVSLLSTFQRSRASKGTEDDGPMMGSLKPGQSQSFPRGTDEPEHPGTRRRMSLSWMSRNQPQTHDSSESAPQISQPFSPRRLNIFGSSSKLFPDRDPETSRPVSIASGTDLPRPSTDSSSIWGPADVGGPAKYRLWTTSDSRWPSRSGSRRQSLHGSTAALTTTLASADDAILDEDDLLNPQTSPSQIGVIGSRPPVGSRALNLNKNLNLNPNAPTFIGQLFRKDKDGDAGVEAKGKDRERSKGKDTKGKGKEAGGSNTELPLPLSDDSPSDSRISRDTLSIADQASVSESHDSFIESTLSTNPSELNVGSVPSINQENVVRKLFRKGSSGKFSLSGRLGKDSSLFKKGPGSATNSDKNMSAEHRSSIGDLDDTGEDVAPLGRSYDSVTSSPSLGPAKGKETNKEGRMSSWRFSVKKKSKDVSIREQESPELDREVPDEE